jgi:hypothetical protein
MTLKQASSQVDDLVARARARADGRPIPPEWGYRIQLAEGEHFVGRWRGQTSDEQNEGRPIYLLWDMSDEPCFSRYYVSLAREVNRVKPSVGDQVAIVRGADYVSQNGTGYNFGLQNKPCSDPLPDRSETDVDGIPF